MIKYIRIQASIITLRYRRVSVSTSPAPVGTVLGRSRSSRVGEDLLLRLEWNSESVPYCSGFTFRGEKDRCRVSCFENS